MSKNTPFRAMLVFVLVLLTSGAAACNKEAGSKNEIRVGLIAPFSDDLASIYGIPVENAANLAVQEINDAGGLDLKGQKYKVALVVGDNEDKAEIAVGTAQRFINQENVVVLVGLPLSRNAIPVAQIAEAAQIPMISVKSSNPDTTAGKQYVFRAVFIDPFQGHVMANFVIDKLGLQKAAVLYDVASAYNKSLAEAFKQAFEEAGGQVVAFETYTTDSNQDFTRQLAHIRDNEPEVLFLPNYFNDVALQVQQARELGINVIFMGGDSWKPEIFAGLPEFDGAFFTEIWAPEMDNGESQAFIKAYRQKYDQEPTITAAITYDAFGLLFEAIQQQGQADPESIREGLANIKHYEGVTGSMEFHGTGDPLRSAVILQLKDGETVLYERIDP
ncbi:MAG: ABC transporter substrate-binding protein [Anaerolineales bacterium]